MNKYGITALKAVELINEGKTDNPVNAWNISAKEVFKDKESSIKKDCPKNAFLGLCGEGLIKGIKIGNYTKSKKNKEYALKAVDILKNTDLSDKVTAKTLWKIVMNGEVKKYNSQMDVVLALWWKGVIENAVE